MVRLALFIAVALWCGYRAEVHYTNGDLLVAGSFGVISFLLAGYAGVTIGAALGAGAL